MLGDIIGEETGRITTQRVMSSDGAPRVETSFQASGTLLGVPATDIATYETVMRPGGTMYGEGQGVLMTADGGSATWKGQGIGRFGPEGSISYRGALYYQTTHESLLRLNDVAAVFEYEVDADGNTKGQLWEWK